MQIQRWSWIQQVTLNLCISLCFAVTLYVTWSCRRTPLMHIFVSRCKIRCKIVGRMEEKHCWLSSGPSSNVQITNNSNNKGYLFLCKTFTKFHQEKPKCALSSIFTRVKQFILRLKRNARIILGNMMVQAFITGLIHNKWCWESWVL